MTGKFDYNMMFFVVLAAANQMGIILGIAFNFKLARQAGLNIGVAQAIWAINPFFQSILDLFLYKSVIQTY